MPTRLVWFALIALLTLPAIAGDAAATPRWWKGNLHTHSLWSDGDDYPEMIAAWYREQGYQFLALSDHNVMLAGERWLGFTDQHGGGEALARYQRRFGTNWVEQRVHRGTNQVRLRTLAEFRGRLEEPGRFLLIPAEEITDRHLTAPLHINATNLREPITARGGSNVLDVMQRNVDAVIEQRNRTGEPMFPHINHPNFGWGITAEELMQLQGEQFFEVYNGHPAVHNEGDDAHAGMERVWDIILTWRLGVLNLPPMLGLAVDDAHHYHTNAVGQSNPGRGWIMVRAPELSAAALIGALEAGDFYASSGVTLADMRREGSKIRLEIAAEPGVTYRTRFIGTRRGFDATHEPLRNSAGEKLRLTHRYSEDVGEVLAEVEGPLATYELAGDELYVRATITSSKPKPNPYRAGETEAAWTQPVLPVANPARLPPAEALLRQTRPLVIAHRGHSAVVPENTLAAFRQAVVTGADLVELDYHHSQDGVPVVIHDDTLDRTTDATNRWGGEKLRVSAYPLERLQELAAGKWFQPPFPDERLPSLTQALETIQPAGVTLIERKAGDAATCVRLLHGQDLINQVVVQSFDWEYLREFHRLEPRQILGALGPPSTRDGRKLTDAEKILTATWLDEIKTLGASITVWNRQVDAAAVKAAHDRGLRVWVYTINEVPLARQLVAAGVDGIITDDPVTIGRAIRETGAQPAP